MYSLEDLNNPENEVIKADAIMDLAMSQLFEMCIEPMQGELEQEELDLIGVIGLALKAIADKAWVHVRRIGEVVPNADAWPITNGFHSVRSEAVEVPTKKADLIVFRCGDLERTA